MPKQSSDALNSLITGINDIQTSLNDNAVSNLGFNATSVPSADGLGLPFSKVLSNKDSKLRRNIITWFIPEFGVVRMYVNPSNITYSDKKLINKDRTKGGYTLQYWGEELTSLSISGTTGSSSVEGINVLHEIYRAEQYAFDATGLSLAANTANMDLSNNLINGIGGSLAGFLGADSPSSASVGAGILGGVFGLDAPGNNLAQQNIPTLAQLAFTVEMYYAGVVYRGFFESFTFRESADNFLMQYDIVFTATQKRGYRQNTFAFAKSANNGPSGPGVPYSFSGKVNPE